MDKSSPRGSGARRVRVAGEHDGRRIDNFLMGELGRVPRSYVYRILRKGEVRVNGGRVGADYRLASGDEVRIPPQRSLEAAPRPDVGRDPRVGELAGRILHEDDALLVLDKPAGLPSHGGSGHHAGVIELFRAARPAAPFLELVHRLDRDTSGCLMIAKTRERLLALQQLQLDAGIDKRYLTVVAGRWPDTLRSIDLPLDDARDNRGVGRARPSAGGKSAVTGFEVMRHLRRATYMEVTLQTGRMHQIRAHASAAGHPLAGDHRYGDPAFNRRCREAGLSRLFLHAHLLRIPEPDGGDTIVSAPLPDELRALIDAFSG